VCFLHYEGGNSEEGDSFFSDVLLVSVGPSLQNSFVPAGVGQTQGIQGCDCDIQKDTVDPGCTIAEARMSHQNLRSRNS
jgi:hypothetical protein